MNRGAQALSCCVSYHFRLVLVIHGLIGHWTVLSIAGERYTFFRIRAATDHNVRIRMSNKATVWTSKAPGSKAFYVPANTRSVEARFKF